MKRTAETAVKRLQVTRERLLALEDGAGTLKLEPEPAALPAILARKLRPPGCKQNGRKQVPDQSFQGTLNEGAEQLPQQGGMGEGL